MLSHTGSTFGGLPKVVRGSQSQYVSYDHNARQNRTQWARKIVHRVRMEEPKARLQRARAAAGFKSPSEAARLVRGLNKNTLISNENGNRPISRKMAEEYAKAFGVDPGWLLYGDQKNPAATSDVDVPLLAMVSAGNLRAQQAVEEHDILRRIKVGDLPNGDWIALQVEGDSMNRVAPDGALILVNRADTRLVDGRFYIFSLGGGEATFKMYKRDPDRLQPFSTNPDHMATPANQDDLYVFGRVRRVIHDV